MTIVDQQPQRILLIRTFKLLKGGGAIPPLGLLYLASSLRETFGSDIELKILDTGLQSEAEVKEEMSQFSPDIVGLSAMSCEADLLASLAKSAKELDHRPKVWAGGPHASILKENLLDDPHIDTVVIGEAEETIVELAKAERNEGKLLHIGGIAFRNKSERITTDAREPISDLDKLPFPAWDLINRQAYGKIPNWNGSPMHDSYAVMASSRGCPYGCYFCHNLFGKKVRARSAKSVFEEIKWLHYTHGVREIHMLDDIFNYSVPRATDIWQRVIDSGIKTAFAFPNGLRADIMTPELAALFRKAGTYKVNFGFETASERLQQMIGKKLNVPKALEMIGHTARTGIITGAYFMFGFPTQTHEEMEETIEVARASHLDMAYFFKATPFPGSRFYDAVCEPAADAEPSRYTDTHFYSVSRSHGDLDTVELNAMILYAQRRFYMRPLRLWRSFWKAPKKLEYMKNLISVFALVIQSFLLSALLKAGKEKS